MYIDTFNEINLIISRQIGIKERLSELSGRTNGRLKHFGFQYGFDDRFY